MAQAVEERVGAPAVPGGAVRPGGRRATPFVRPLRLRGWAPSSWGYDPALECFWADLRPDGDAAPVRIGRRHLIATVPGLARAVARTARVPAAEAYLALTR
jgi:hypothetical protein